MTELRPTGSEESPFFLFLQRLPKELRIVLGDVEDHEDVRAMANKMDNLWCLQNYQQHGLVVSVDSSAPSSATGQPSAIIAALKGESSSSSSQPAGSLPTTTAELARSSAGLCFFHWKHGDKADRCKGDCSWQGN
jgi:hypothetical protein